MDTKKALRRVAEEVITELNMPYQGTYRFIYDRLEWMLAMGFEIGRAENQSLFKKPIVQMDRGGVIIAIFPSMKDAAKKTNVYITGISEVCREKRKTAGGFKWEFLNSNDFYKGRHLDKPKNEEL